MAEHLASIFGTEKDRVNCPFYFKIGACRHGDRCSRLHTRPGISPTILLSNMYQRPDMITPGVDPQGQAIDPNKIQQHFEDFYEDLFEELSKYGTIENLNICDNLADHMVGNVYVQFKEAEDAASALQNLTGRFYAGRPIIVDFSPVTDFREATCRQYEENVCNRGGYCNFMHLKKINRELRRQLFGRSSKRRHSRSPSRNQPYEERPRGGGSRRGGDDGDHHHSDRSRRHRSRSPGRRGGRRSRSRSRSPRGGGGRRNRSPPVRENSEERRAMIAQWNKEREQGEDKNVETDADAEIKNENGNNHKENFVEREETDSHQQEPEHKEHRGYDDD
ncbi:splicing factor U2af small subunit B-like [Impatiens glandulifera]|uniref:splicing factor U2af small subunit B-like n=1 Tax=Impatiens glandulifera TaxID=253017 RepID=UPI001FB13040|nr:splicing factor U2af small subunit B-like [Impatiens glandulifera]XP_047316565.1 splicing factor U2af small subunit B-like [Impatiens glandulifera]